MLCVGTRSFNYVLNNGIEGSYNPFGTCFRVYDKTKVTALLMMAGSGL